MNFEKLKSRFLKQNNNKTRTWPTKNHAASLLLLLLLWGWGIDCPVAYATALVQTWTLSPSRVEFCAGYCITVQAFPQEVPCSPVSQQLIWLQIEVAITRQTSFILDIEMLAFSALDGAKHYFTIMLTRGFPWSRVELSIVMSDAICIVSDALTHCSTRQGL